MTDNTLDKVTNLKEGWEFFLKVFRDVIPNGEEYKFKGAYYAGAATYDAILFNSIAKHAKQQVDADDEDAIHHMNITDVIIGLHNEVGEFASKRVEESTERINEIQQSN